MLTILLYSLLVFFSVLLAMCAAEDEKQDPIVKFSFVIIFMLIALAFSGAMVWEFVKRFFLT